MGRLPYWSSSMEVSYCTFGFGMIIRRVIHCAINYMRAWFKSTQERQLTLNEIAGGLSYKKKSGGTITRLHTWWQDIRHNRFPSSNFVDLHTSHNPPWSGAYMKDTCIKLTPLQKYYVTEFKLFWDFVLNLWSRTTCFWTTYSRTIWSWAINNLAEYSTSIMLQDHI